MLGTEVTIDVWIVVNDVFAILYIIVIVSFFKIVGIVTNIAVTVFAVVTLVIVGILTVVSTDVIAFIVGLSHGFRNLRSPVSATDILCSFFGISTFFSPFIQNPDFFLHFFPTLVWTFCLVCDQHFS